MKLLSFLGGVALVALLLVPAASSQNPNEYTAGVTPGNVAAGTSGASFTFTVTNSGSSGNLGSVDITAPAGFSSVNTGTVTASGGKTWNATFASGAIQLRAATGSDTLLTTESVSVGVTANAPTNTGSYTWTTAASSTTDLSSIDFTLSGSDPSVTVDPDHFAVSPESATQTAGTPFDLVVTAKDAANNTISNYTGTVHFTSTDTKLSTVLPGNYTFLVADNGQHTFLDGVTLTTTGAQTVSVNDTVATSAVGNSGDITVNPGPIDHFTLTAPASTTAGDPFSTTVSAFDEFDNPKTDYTGTVHFSTTDPGSQTTLPADYTFTGSGGGNDNGVHTFSAPNDGVKLTKTTSQTFSVEDTGNPATLSTSSPVTVIPGPLDHFLWTQQPTAVTACGVANTVQFCAGVPFNAAVTAYDAFDNVKTNYTGSTATFSGLGTSPPPINAGPTYNFTWGVGTGVATGTATDRKAELAKLTVADTTVNPNVSKDSNQFTVMPDVPATLTFTNQPKDTRCSSAVCTSGTGTTVISVDVKDVDQFGNPEVGVNVKISIASPNPGTPTPGNLGGTTVKAADNNGVASFGTAEALNIDNVGLQYTLKAESPDTSPTANTTSNAFNIANSVKTCNGNCTANATSTNTTAMTTLTNVGQVSITITPQSAGTCNVISKPTGDIVTVNPTGTTTGNVTVTGRFLHQNNAGGIGNYVLCKDSGPGTLFHQIFACSKKVGPPCYTKLSGNGMGDILFTVTVKQNNNGTFDPSMTGGGH